MLSLRPLFYFIILVVLSASIGKSVSGETYDLATAIHRTDLTELRLNSSSLKTYYADNKPIVGFNDASGFIHSFVLEFSTQIYDRADSFSLSLLIQSDVGSSDFYGGFRVPLGDPISIMQAIYSDSNVTYIITKLAENNPVNTSFGLYPTVKTDTAPSYFNVNLVSSIFFRNGSTSTRTFALFSSNSLSYSTSEGPGKRFLPLEASNFVWPLFVLSYITRGIYNRLKKS